MSSFFRETAMGQSLLDCNLKFRHLLLATTGFLCLFLPAPGWCIDHSGAISTDTTWLAAENPHVITGSVTVQVGITLTLQPGVQVQGNPGQVLQIYGHLEAPGLTGQEITLDRSQPSGTWGGIYVQSTGTVNLDHCDLLNSYYGINHNSAGTITITNSTIGGAVTGINANGSGPVQLGGSTIEGCTVNGFYGNGNMLTLLDGANSIENCATGLNVSNVGGLSLTTSLTVTGCTVTGVQLFNCSSPSLDNLVLTGNTGTNGAILLNNCGEFTLGSGNQIGGTGQENTWPVSITAGSYPVASCVIPTSGNTNNNIRVHGGASNSSGTWHKFTGLDYIITGTVQVQAGGSLTIAPTVRVRSNSGQGLNIYGTLIAEADPGQEILFERHAATGTWGGIYANGGGSLSLENCQLSNGYYGVLHSSTGSSVLTGVTITGSTNGVRATGGLVQLAGCTISDNGYGFYGAGVGPTFLDSANYFENNGTGLYVNGIAGLAWTTPLTITGSTTTGIHLVNCLGPSLDNLVLTDNQGVNGAFLLASCGDFTLGGGNQIGGTGQENLWPVSLTAGSYATASSIIPTTGNTNNNIRVHSGASDLSGTWRLFPGLDYIITASPQVQAGGSLTIEPAVQVRCNSGQGLNIYGTLLAEAEAGQEIHFSRNAATGTWSGIYVQGGGSISLAHCQLDFGYYGIYQNSSGTTSLTSTTISNSINGIRATSGQVQMASCIISDSNHGFWGQGVQPNLVDSANLFTDNGTGIYIRNLPGLAWTSPVTITGSTTTGMELINCDGFTGNNIVVQGNTGVNGAFLLNNCAEFTLGSGNQIGGTGYENTWPLSITAGSYPSAGCVIPATGNTNNNIRVHSGASDRSGTWRKFADLDYIITGTVQVQAGGSLDIQPGVLVLANQSQGLNIYGTLTAHGETGQEIVFTRQAATGTWSGLYVQGGGTANLDHCLIEFGYYGIYHNSSGTTTVNNTTISNAQNGIRTGSGLVQLGGCHIMDNGFGFYGTGVRPTLLDGTNVFDGNATGIYIRDLGGITWTTATTITGNTTTGLQLVNCTGPSLNNLVLTGNTGMNGALAMDNCGEFTLGSGNQIGGEGNENTWPLSISSGSFPAADCIIPMRGNINNDIRVHGGASDRSGTWRKLPGMNYIITGSLQVQSGGSLTIDPMVHVFSNTGQGITIYGTLTTLGELGKMVLFDRAGATGTWSGIHIQGAGVANLAHTRIDHATYGVYHSSSGASQLFHNIIRNGQTGLYLVGGTVELLNNRIHDNTQYGVYIAGGTPVFGSSDLEWNDIHNNGSGVEGRALRNGPADLTAAYVYWGTVLSEEISTAITDHADNQSLGVVTFIPFSDEAHNPQSPVLDPQVVPGAVPARFAMAQNHPNPFNPRTTLAFDLTRPSAVELAIFNLKGERVVTLVDEFLSAGKYSQVWDGCDEKGRAQASGVFFYRLTSDEGTLTRRMTMVR